ncbi:MAG: hypothetical protein LBT76_01200 [Tannerella sp.]|nr:hypothetical protein [Tannerella sp.]
MEKNHYIRFDRAIKRRQKTDFVILEGFLSTVLGDRIRIENILDSEGNNFAKIEFEKHHAIT